ncbi:acyl-phosphate glycerol 3-phosphate acyltransferase [candidate division WOR-1 bacterium RIFCSPLOWO2_02_FULL_46_20]|uniref:Glycerol-3-phosphate acyltransferase n=2 Tax=Saganbacteria TaxID=1703751 RepID=A0A1F4R4Y6_UNCSA|nr:MAG: acyl-phosphate glycerol 3-phosphate acyltransferase [candidate division WOR-1 bacterium RIFCSPHIGHO2_02_FULL_45_12]OGC03180.1 MAG: acyl-phosphate glycerol 3-phosphate acyltransferase [candidate division WOR-1 bacterium RIFCSPLOWO2_02_FULL_46_20]OGC09823.1 MAG: acyl-phosphate glycerol 3-phosphate acyltransferase [candidate division WOR-1 bacterium RIFCSPLOWO2_12_FULL_45_9]
MAIQTLAVIILAYFLGSIPFGFLIAKIWNVDIRRHGSGNIGATNVLRNLGPIPGSIVFILDLAKGTLPILMAQPLTQNYWLITLSGAAAILGHTFPIFLKFKGGRGAATGLGVLLGIAPDVFAVAVIFALLVLFITRYISVVSMSTAILVTSIFFVLQRPQPYTIVAGLVAILIIVRHISNIKRLINKTEPKIGASRG